MSLTYKSAATEDISVIFSLCKALIDAYEDVSNIDYEMVLKWVKNKITENIFQYTCVFLNDTKVGYFHLQHGGETELDDFYILPEYRGRGIGTEVLSYCIKQTNSPLFLYVFRRNTGAIKLYNRMGFYISQEVGNTRLIMRREVDNR